MQVVLNATLSHLYCMLGDIHMFTDTFWCKTSYYFSDFYISTHVLLTLILLMKSTLGVV